MRMEFSDEVKRMDKMLEPYYKRYSNGTPRGGIRDDAPPEMKKLFEKLKKKVEEESWL